MSWGVTLLLLLWVACSTGSGFLLALLARRIHPSLSLLKLWVFYSVLMALFVAVILVVAGL